SRHLPEIGFVTEVTPLTREAVPDALTVLERAVDDGAGGDWIRVVGPLLAAVAAVADDRTAVDRLRLLLPRRDMHAADVAAALDTVARRARVRVTRRGRVVSYDEG
ncbi:MAG TPA: hypothetical protein VFT95_14710, partial [Micromonosporaceae bacterium]|nr:hypothetical protein [Micromonosporaceae bacterium]